jgi:hypothetical protein
MPDSNGPYLQSAAICEKVVESKDGVLSLINIVDQITQTASGPEPPENLPPFILQDVTIVIMLKAGEARGRYAIKLRPTDPSGRDLPDVETTVQLQGGNSGINIVSPLQLAVENEGTYWFNVFFMASSTDERLLTRIPLTVMYERQRVTTS